jgi:nicotinamidase/pyrazinamidase
MTALILVDIQNDFLEYGALAVPDGNAVIAVANEMIPQYDIVVATQDWHPANHGSFAANHPWRKPGQIIELDGLPQMLWPIHCVQNSYGALFAKDLHTDHITKIFQKGTDVNIDSYSGFYDNGHRKSTGMGEYLQAQGVTEVTIMGLATDYCVKFTALDALSFGF